MGSLSPWERVRVREHQSELRPGKTLTPTLSRTREREKTW